MRIGVTKIESTFAQTVFTIPCVSRARTSAERPHVNLKHVEFFLHESTVFKKLSVRIILTFVNKMSLLLTVLKMFYFPSV